MRIGAVLPALTAETGKRPSSETESLRHTIQGSALH